MKEHDLTRRALYFDFYGSLLTDKQREIYDLYYQQDLSFGEISKIRSVSREAVYDLLKRTEEALKFYESKLGLVKKYQLSREISKEIAQKIENIRKRVENDRKDRQLQEELAQLAELLQKLDDSW
ncbi:MAG: YlxM family DNA-binding protein [Clostridia bacterium]|jgi:predicted DNA-binding protein YlxM (UPF0122 family)|nr:YlxM family DNA-binding protein [Clostridia bacterium]